MTKQIKEKLQCSLQYLPVPHLEIKQELCEQAFLEGVNVESSNIISNRFHDYIAEDKKEFVATVEEVNGSSTKTCERYKFQNFNQMTKQVEEKLQPSSQYLPVPHLEIKQELCEQIFPEGVSVESSNITFNGFVDYKQEENETLIETAKKDDKSSMESYNKFQDDNHQRCAKCGDVFRNNADLQNHLKTNHSTDKTGPRIRSDSSNDQVNVKDHDPYHTNKKQFKCSHCMKLFSRKSALLRHSRTHTDEQRFTCDQCDEKFKWSSQLLKHIGTFHAHHKPCNLFLSDKPTTLKQDISTHTSVRNFKCRYCDKSFFHASNQKVHERIHTGEKPYKCNKCDAVFAYWTSLQTHVIRHHSKEFPFKCLVCDKKFIQNSELEQHKLTHTGVRIFKCRYCDKSFLHACNQKVHERIHTGEKPYKCSECNAGFAYATSLRTHIIRLHSKEFPFKCLICDKKFIQLRELEQHKLTHSVRNFKCQYCDKNFSDAQGLKNHELTHTGVRNFKCQYCYKKFLKETTLKAHEQLHTGGKRFKCKECDASYSHASSLRHHVNCHHSK